MLRAGTVPQAPEKPYFITSTETTIKLGLIGSQDNGGSVIRKY